jgi:hypothetical protein
MADRTLTINHADGGSETYTIKRDKFAGVREMSIDGSTVTVDRTAVPKEQSKETTFGGSQSITIKREIEPLLSEVVGGASAAYSLRDLNDKAGNNKVVRVRRASDNTEKDFRAKEVKDIAKWANAQVVPPLDVRELVDGERTGALIPAAAAYSLRNLGSGFIEFVVDVRRSSDNALEAFSAAQVADGTLTTWVGAGNDGFVAGWYDQSGNGNHAIQTDAASQPKIVDAGVLVSGGILFTGSSERLQIASASTLGIDGSNNRSIFSVLKTPSGTDGFMIFGNTGGTYATYRHRSSNASGLSRIEIQGSGFDGADISDGNTHLFSSILDGTQLQNVSIFVDGSETSGSGTATLNTADNDFFIGSINGALSENTGTLAELIVYASSQSDNQTAFEANIAETYGIDLPSGVDTGYDQVDGFVETWYDQSGNGNDAVQETAGSQPKIVDAGVLVSGGIDFDGVDDFFDITSGYTATNGAVFIVENLANTDPIQTFMGGGTGNAAGSGYLPLMQSGSTSTGTYIGATVTNDYLNGSVQSLSTRGDYFTAICNNTSQLFSAIGVTTSLSYTKLGKGGTSNWELDGTLAEVILYPSDQSANRAAIETNINNQYDIY